MSAEAMSQLTYSQCDGTQIETDEPIEPMDMDVGVDPVLVSPEMRAMEEEKKDEKQGEAMPKENDGEKKVTRKRREASKSEEDVDEYWEAPFDWKAMPKENDGATRKRREASKSWEDVDEYWEASFDWMEVCSKHLHNIEGRLMESEYLAHEVVRQIMSLITTWIPAPRGDWGWLLRRCTDIGVRQLRQLTRYYMRSGEELKSFAMQAVTLVRLFFEEAFHRCLVGARWGMRSSLCSILTTMKEFEEDTLTRNASDFGFFWTFSEANVRRIAEKVARNETTSVEDMPSWPEVNAMPLLKLEASSLMLVRVVPSSIKMSRREVKTIIEARGKPLTEEEMSKLPGCEGPSVFEDIFPMG